MSALPSNWPNAFRWLRESWTDPEVPWVEQKAGFLEQLGLSDEAQDPAVAEFFRRVDQEFGTDAERRAALTDEARQHEFQPAPIADDVVSGPSDDEATSQGFSADHVQAQRLGLPYWDAENQRYLYYDEASQDWLDEPAAGTESQWDAELGAELPFASLGDAEVAQLFYADEVHPEFAEAVAGGDITIEPALIPAVAGTISDE
jgi:hypothetical protein